MAHPFQTTISEAELIRRHNETLAAQRAAEQQRQQNSPAGQPQKG